MTGASSNFRRSPDCEMIRISADATKTYKEMNMSTPQNILNNIEFKLGRLIDILERDGSQDIYDMCKGIEIETTEFNERMEALEDKMNLIIKLLGKCNE